MLVGFVTTKIFYQRVAHWRGKEYSVVRDQSGCVLLVSRVHYEAGYQQYEQTYLTLPRMNDGGFFLQPDDLPLAPTEQVVEAVCPEACCTLIGVPVSGCPPVRYALSKMLMAAL